MLGHDLLLNSTTNFGTTAIQEGPNCGERLESLSSARQRWYAVCVSPRHEKAVASYLMRSGVSCLLPTYRSCRRWKDRQKELDMVLFPNYVFVNLDLQQRMRVLRSPGVSCFVTFQGKPAPIQDSEIRPLALGARAGLKLEPHPYLRRGRRVRVVRGPLTETEGLLVRRKERYRLVLSVELIMRSMMVEVDESDVEPC
jgi:transcription antitermination factor NusG